MLLIDNETDKINDLSFDRWQSGDEAKEFGGDDLISEPQAVQKIHFRVERKKNLQNTFQRILACVFIGKNVSILDFLLIFTIRFGFRPDSKSWSETLNVSKSSNTLTKSAKFPTGFSLCFLSSEILGHPALPL